MSVLKKSREEEPPKLVSGFCVSPTNYDPSLGPPGKQLISFSTGCYPGQEIVARTQYLGKLKRRMYRAHIATDDRVSAGDDLYGADFEDQSCGKIVNAVSSPRGGYDVLAVIQQSSVATGKVYWTTSQGAVLTIETLPYALD